MGKRKVLTLSGNLCVQVDRKTLQCQAWLSGQARPHWMAGSRGAFDGLEEFHLRDLTKEKDRGPCPPVITLTSQL